MTAAAVASEEVRAESGTKDEGRRSKVEGRRSKLDMPKGVEFEGKTSTEQRGPPCGHMDRWIYVDGGRG